MTRYVRFPIETNPQQLMADVYAYLQTRAPQWSPNDSALDVWIIQALAAVAADNRDLASDVPDDIFRYFGATVMGFPPVDATASTVESTWTMIDNAGYTIEAGTQVAIRNSSGDQIPFETVNEVIIPAGSTVASNVLLRSTGEGAETAALGGVGVAITLLDILSYVLTVTIAAATSGGVDAETTDAYMDRLSRHMRLMSMRPILPNDFALLARETVPAAFRVVAIDGYNPLHNLLTANQASVETDATGWAALTNVNVTRSLTQAADGVASLSMSSVAAGDMVAQSNPNNTVAVLPGDTITAIASFRAATTGRSARVTIRWLDAAFATISDSAGSNVADVTTGWTQASVTAAAPATAAYARLLLTVVATGGVAEVHYADKMSVRKGSGTDWVAGGTGPTNQERMVTVASIDLAGNNVSTQTKTDIDTILQANREVNFVVNVMDPNRNTIDVNFTAKAAAGYAAADVSARAVSALQAYLSPLNWGVPADDSGGWNETTTLRFSEVAQVLSNVEGLDYWTVLQMRKSGGTFAAADVALTSPASLTVPGTITPTVT